MRWHPISAIDFFSYQRYTRSNWKLHDAYAPTGIRGKSSSRIQPVVTTPVRGPGLPMESSVHNGMLSDGRNPREFQERGGCSDSVLWPGAITYLITTRSILAKLHTAHAVISPFPPRSFCIWSPNALPRTRREARPRSHLAHGFPIDYDGKAQYKVPYLLAYSISTSANPNPGLPSPAAGSRSRCQMVVLAWPLGPTNRLSQPGALHLAFAAGAFCTSPSIARHVLHLCTQLKSPARVVPLSSQRFR